MDMLERLAQELGARWGEQVLAAVLVHRAPKTGGGGLSRVFGKGLASKLHTNNLLALTPTHLRLTSLGGRTGMKPGDDLAVWRREEVRVFAQDQERSTYMASMGGNHDYRTYELRIVGAGVDLVVDVMAPQPDEEPLFDPRPHLQAILAGTTPIT